MKKNLYICLVLLVLFCITSCGGKAEEVITVSEIPEISISEPEESSAEQKEESQVVAAVKEEDSAVAPPDAAVGEDYFDDAVFIGDSRTQGFIYYNGLSNATAYVDKGLNVDTALNKAFVELNGKNLTIFDALKETEFKKVYLMLGINELGWVYSDIFIEKYGQIIDSIKAVNPDTIIYVQSILPVGQEKSESDSVFNMTKINEYNLLIKEMTEQKGVIYLNVSEAVADEDGYLPQTASSDGIHLKKGYCVLWLEYLKNNAV